MAWNNSVRSRLYLPKPARDDGATLARGARELTVMKANYGQFYPQEDQFSGDKLKTAVARGCVKSPAAGNPEGAICLRWFPPGWWTHSSPVK